nr:14645_t:CDS:2 [Entrophospora candida]
MYGDVIINFWELSNSLLDPNQQKCLPPVSRNAFIHFSNWKKLTNVTAKRLPAVVLAKIFVVSFISVDLLYAWYRNRLIERLKRIFQPYEDQSFYQVICEEHGTWRTTRTRIPAKEVGQGVICVDIPANIMKLGEAIGKAINFSFEKDISFTTQLSWAILVDDVPTSSWSRAKSPVMEIVGGRIIELKAVADDFLAGQSFEVIKQQIVTEVKKKFDFTNLLRGRSRHEVGKRVIGALLVSKEIDTDVFREFFSDENPVKF